MYVLVVPVAYSCAVGASHNNAERVAAQVLVKVTLIGILRGQVDEQLLRLILLCWDERGGHGTREELVRNGTVGAPFWPVRHRELSHTACNDIVANRGWYFGRSNHGLETGHSLAL